MKKKILSIIMVATIATLLAGCGNTEIVTSEATATGESITAEQSTEPETTETATEEPTETPTAEPEATETPEPEETSTEEPEPSEAPAYTYTDMSKTMYAQSNVNVRDLPSTDGNKLGGLNTNDEVQVTGQCNETSWYRFEYNGSVAYVSDKYLGDNKVEVTASAPATQSNTTGTTSSSGNWYDGYELYTWYDMGEYYFLMATNIDEATTYGNNFPSEYRNILQERYPDRTVIWGGTGPSTGPYKVTVFSALYTEADTGFPIWTIDYVWD